MTIPEQQKIAHSKVIQEVKALYNAPPDLLPHFQNDFTPSSKQKCLYSTYLLKTWIYKVHLYTACTTQWCIEECQSYKDICSYFRALIPSQLIQTHTCSNTIDTMKPTYSPVHTIVT